MDGKRGSPPAAAAAEPDGRAAAEDPGDVPSERYGPLELRRMRKDDGRSLIVFRRAVEER